MPRTTKRLLEKLREVEALKDERRYRPPGILTKLGKAMAAFFRDYVGILEHLLSGEPFPRLAKILFTIGAIAMGPGLLYGVIYTLIAGEIRRHGAVILAAKADPFAFYTTMLICVVGATLGTVLAVALLVAILKGRAGSRS